MCKYAECARNWDGVCLYDWDSGGRPERCSEIEESEKRRAQGMTYPLPAFSRDEEYDPALDMDEMLGEYH